MDNRIHDFSGWATRYDVKCTDGLTIKQDAFKFNDGKVVPIVWMHLHNDPSNVLGHGILENRPEGVYVKGWLNSNKKAQDSKGLLQNGDIKGLSIYATGVKKNGNVAVHGDIKEVSLVIAGANPGAYIDNILVHGEIADDEFVYTFADSNYPVEDSFKHEDKENPKQEKETNQESEVETKNKTVQDVINSMTDIQQKVMYGLIGEAVKNIKTEEDENMKHNLFDGKDHKDDDVIAHSEEIVSAIKDGKRYGSLKESFIQHGIENIDYLFPEPKAVDKIPQIISDDMTWVSEVMNGVYKSPFSRIKTVFANITEDEARAMGYIKGNMKKEEFFTLSKRRTDPTTVYKKQKLDRDDVIDIDIDTVGLIKMEMRQKLEEEIARAILISDGRNSSSDDKINEQNIRPIYKDEDLFTIKAVATVASSAGEDEKVKAVIRTAVKARKNYKGSGSPVFFTTEDFLSDALLMEDKNGRLIYEDETKLAKVLRVKKIVTVPCMENVTGVNSHELVGIIVNLKDYAIGADKGGAISIFDDFDIDFNAMKYLIETRCSGALIRAYSAIAIERNISG